MNVAHEIKILNIKKIEFKKKYNSKNIRIRCKIYLIRTSL